MQWMPIESAPKERKALLGFWHDGVWHVMIGSPRRFPEMTHYIPLPDPPQSDA